jgi:4-hydroxy-tetrahydrodipicolinate synthase
MSKFVGLGVAMVTPFTAQGKLDFAGLKRLTEHLVSNGADYLVVQGTTGESVTLTTEEKRTVLDYILEVNNKRKPVVLGVGGNNTLAVAEQLRNLDIQGLSGILSVSPYYNKPTQAGIYAHYRALSEASPLPIILYNVPGRTGSNMAPETTLRLAHDFKNIVAIKEASGNLSQMEEIMQHRPAGFSVISGDDNLTLPAIALGADGVISVVGNAFPAAYSKMVHQALFGSVVDARLIHYRLRKLVDLLFVEGNPGGIKEVLHHLGICENHMRLPLMPVSEATRDKLYRELAERELVKV